MIARWAKSCATTSPADLTSFAHLASCTLCQPFDSKDRAGQIACDHVTVGLDLQMANSQLSKHKNPKTKSRCSVPDTIRSNASKYIALLGFDFGLRVAGVGSEQQ